MPIQQWNNETPLYHFDSGVFYYCQDQINEYCEEHLIPLSDLKLILCEPNNMEEVEIDYWSDSFVDWPELPSEIQVISIVEENIEIMQCSLSLFSPAL